MTITRRPLFRLFKLRIKPDKQADFLAVGKQNLLTSIDQESGTLAMYTGHLDSAGTENRVIELYRDQASYEVHANSPQFQAFKNVASQVVIEQSVINLNPILLMEQSFALRLVNETSSKVYLTEFKVETDKLSEFREIVTSEIEHAHSKEPGLLVTYLGQNADVINKFILFEAYEDFSAYQKHRQSTYFKKFQKGSLNLGIQSQTFEIKPDVLVNQGKLFFQSN